MTKLAIAVALVIALSVAGASIAGAQGPDVQIAQLECTGDPELVVIENLGDAEQGLAGWELQSEPVVSEAFDLSTVGSLQPGASVTIQSGPSAGGAFIWSSALILRDDDPTDYARIVDDTGAIVHQMDCAVAPEPTPTATATAVPTPTAEPTPVNDVPNGGGLPPADSVVLQPSLMVTVGGFLAATGAAILALPRLLLRSWFGSGPAGTPEASAARRRSAGAISRENALFGLALMVLAAFVFFFLLLWQRKT